MLLYKADENGIIFHTASSKDLYDQVLKNLNAELCLNCNGTQIRISGQLEIIGDNTLKNEIYEHPTCKFLHALERKLNIKRLLQRPCSILIKTWNCNNMDYG